MQKNNVINYGLPQSIQHFQCFTSATNAALDRPFPARGRQRVPSMHGTIVADGWDRVADPWKEPIHRRI